MRIRLAASAIIVFISLMLSGGFSFARETTVAPHEPIRRLVVFPFEVEEPLQQVAEESWWSLRERLTEDKRFLIASKNFMEVKDVYQPRGLLKPADAIILGRLLDAHALVTVTVKGYTVSMQVYETTNGATLWQRELELHAALAVSKQLPDALRKLALDFSASIPYQGYVIVDALIGRPTYMQAGRTYVKADIGEGSQVKVKDPAQIISITPKSLQPLFEQKESVEVLAEGVVTEVDRNIVTIEITRQREGVKLAEGALVRMPQELRRLQELYSLSTDLVERAGLQTLGQSIGDRTREQQERKPLVTSLSFIANLALVLLLAF